MANEITATGMTLLETEFDKLRFSDFFTSISTCYGLSYLEDPKLMIDVTSLLVSRLIRDGYLQPIESDVNGWALYKQSEKRWENAALEHLRGFLHTADWQLWNFKFWMSGTEKTRGCIERMHQIPAWKHYLDFYSEEDYPLGNRSWTKEEIFGREAQAIL